MGEFSTLFNLWAIAPAMRNIIFLFLASLIMFACKGRFFKNPTTSMEETIKRGQKFYVEPSKSFKHNDIIVFDYFGIDYNSRDETGQFSQKEQKRLMRLIAMSGDVFVIRHGEVYLNNVLIPLPPLGKMEYEIASKIPLAELRDPEQVYASQSGDSFKYIAPLTVEEVNNYANNKTDIFSLKKHLREEFSIDTFFAKASTPGTWSLDDYGPLKIPSPGDSIFVNDTNYKLFHNIPGIHLGSNIIRDNLYFLMGDNRHFVEDSRFIGLISQSKMYGIVVQ